MSQTTEINKISESDITFVAKRVFSSGQWLQQFGRPIYNIKSVATVNRQAKAEKEFHELMFYKQVGLPFGWDSAQLNNQYYLFHPQQDPEQTLQTINSIPRRLKLSDRDIDNIRREKENNFEVGLQSRLARHFNTHKTNISRIVNGKYRRKIQLPERMLTIEELTGLTVDAALVSRVFERLFSITEWVELVGKNRYKISSRQYVYEMCRQKLNGPRGYKRYPAHLPGGWASVKLSDSWYIYNPSLQTKNEYLDLK